MPKRTLFLIHPENIADRKAIKKFIKSHPFLKGYELTDEPKKSNALVVLPFSDGAISSDVEKAIHEALNKNKTVYFIRTADFNVRIIKDTNTLAVLNDSLTASRKERNRSSGLKESYEALIRLQLRKTA